MVEVLKRREPPGASRIVDCEKCRSQLKVDLVKDIASWRFDRGETIGNFICPVCQEENWVSR